MQKIFLKFRFFKPTIIILSKKFVKNGKFCKIYKKFLKIFANFCKFCKNKNFYKAHYIYRFLRSKILSVFIDVFLTKKASILTAELTFFKKCEKMTQNGRFWRFLTLLTKSVTFCAHFLFRSKLGFC